MNISVFISRFIYRIRYQMLFTALVVTVLVAYFTQFLPKTYTVETTIYTGIVSSTAVINGETTNFQTINNTYDNLLNLIKSKTTLENVAIKLLATNLMYGDLNKDNMTITAVEFQKLDKQVPEEVKRLIDKKSLDNTIKKLKQYKQNYTENFLYRLLNNGDPHHSVKALSAVETKRIGSSDMIQISYTSDDPGITTNTVKYMSEELRDAYNNLRYRSTNDAIKYFEEQVKKYGDMLHKQEVELSNYKITNNIINYDEQTKSTAGAFATYEDQMSDVKKRLSSSQALLKMLDKQMQINTDLLRTNKKFLKALDDVATTSGDIVMNQLFSDKESDASIKRIKESKVKQEEAKNYISKLTNDMDIYKYSKQGVEIENMVDQWLSALLEYTAAKGEQKVLIERQKEFDEKYRKFSPVGTEIKSRERGISVTERTYLEMIDALNTANLRKRNIELTTAGLDIVTEPSFPLSPNGSKRMMLIMAAFFGTMVFVLLYNLLIELLDRTIRDQDRAERLIGIHPICVFSGRGQLRYRGFSKTWNRRSAEYLCNKLNEYVHPNRTAVINLLSIERREGKSHIARFLVDEWEKEGIKVRYVKAGEDFITDASFILSDNFSQLCSDFNDDEDKPDVLLIEYPALQKTIIPPALLIKADINILIANAARAWKRSDDEMVKHINKIKEKSPFTLCVNNTMREPAEDYVGPLPPNNNSSHSIGNKMRHMGLTAKDNGLV